MQATANEKHPHNRPKVIAALYNPNIITEGADFFAHRRLPRRS